MKKIIIEAGDLSIEAELNDSSTAQAIYDALPFSSSANRWGDEIYFSIPVKAEPENPQELVNIGDLGYWPDGSALCIFFGPTPISSAGEIRPASGVNLVGHVLGDPGEFKKVSSGEEIIVEEEE